MTPTPQRTCSLLLIALAVLIISFVRCSFDKPSAPSWDVPVTIPLISKTYTMAEIAEDESSLTIDSTGMLNFEVEAELDSYYVGDQLTLKELQESFTLGLGTFKVESPGTEETAVELRDIYSDADAFDGTTVVVPPFSIDTGKKPLEPYENFTRVVIDTGRLQVRVENDMTVPLGTPLILEIWDTDADVLLMSKTRDVRINPGESKVFLLNLAARTLPNKLSVRITGESPGSEGSPVLVDADDTFAVRASVSELTVTEAVAKIPEQIVTNADQVLIDEPLEIIEGKIERGLIHLSIENRLPVDAWVTYRLPDFRAADGRALVDSFAMSQNTTTTVGIDLAGYSLMPAAAAIGEQQVNFTWTARTIDTGATDSEHVLVRSSDFVSAVIDLVDVQFSQISGRIGEKDIDLSENEIEFDIPVDIDSVFFQTANMELHLNNSIYFPASIDVMILGENEAGAISQLAVQQSIQSARAPGVPSTSVIVLNQQNSNIQQFISILPSFLRVFGNATLGDQDWTGSVSKDDFINGFVKLSAPFALNLPPQNIDSEVDAIEIDDDIKSDIEDNLSAGTFFINISNHLPMGASVEFNFAEDESLVFTEPILQIGPVHAENGAVDASGFVQEPQQSNITIDLTENQMRTFLLENLYAAIRVAVDGTGEEFVQVRGSDYIRVQSFSKITMKINQD